MIEDIPCVILAGGKSSRMGEDKSLIQITPNQTLIEYQFDKLSNIFSNVLVSSKEDKFKNLYPLILDTSEIYSPMVALYTILKSIDENEYVCIVPVDTPNISQISFKILVDNIDTNEITIAKTDSKSHFLCGVFKTSIKEKIKKLLNEDNHKIKNLIEICKLNEIYFENENEFINLNSKEDLKDYLSFN